MSAARKYTRAGTRRRTGTPVGAGGTAVGTDFGAAHQSLCPVEQQSVPNSVLVKRSLPVERQPVPEEFVAIRGAPQSVPEESQRTVAERQSLAISGLPIRPFRCAKPLFLRAWQTASTDA